MAEYPSFNESGVHRRNPSAGTNASFLSAASNLPHFPPPPTEIPRSPISYMNRSTRSSTSNLPKVLKAKPQPTVVLASGSQPSYSPITPTSTSQLLRPQPTHSFEKVEPKAQRMPLNESAISIEPSKPGVYDAFVHRKLNPAASIMSNGSDMISTSFITSLLSSEDERSVKVPKHYASSYVSGISDMSAISEMTYPPTSRFFKKHTPSENIPPVPSRQPDLRQQPIAEEARHSTNIPDRPSNYQTSENTSKSTHSEVEYTHPIHSPPPFYTNEDSNMLHVPEFIRGSSTGLSNAESLPGFGPKNMSRSNTKRNSEITTRTTKTRTSSLIHLKSTVASWFNKDNARQVAPPSLPVSTEPRYQHTSNGMPSPDSISSAGRGTQSLEQKENSPLSSISISHHANSSTSKTNLVHRSEKDRPLRSMLERGTPAAATKRNKPWSKRNKLIVVGTIAFVMTAIAIGVIVGVMKSKKAITCDGQMTGNSCELDGFCLCTSSIVGQCNPLAKSILELTPVMNSLFNTSYTKTTMSAAIFAVQGAPIGNDCRPQALVVDVSPALLSSKFPNRTTWAQAALLWNYVQSHDIAATSQIARFVSNAPWSTLTEDGITANPKGVYATTQSGYIFDFADQTITPPPISFLEGGQPSAAQISQVSSTAHAVLDKMYSLATAASTQRTIALQAFWRSNMGQKPEDLSTFMSIASASPVLLSFDASNSASTGPISLVSNSTTNPFPPPLSCYPGLDNITIQEINQVEVGIFGLPPASTVDNFSTSCFADRPIYGVLDLVQLRLPFQDSRQNVAKQAVALNRDTRSRVAVRNGEMLSALPGKAMPSNTTNPYQQYGTLNYFDHVMLDYLTSMDVTLAQALVRFVLNNSVVPPSNTSNLLFDELSKIPILEVAVFGTINPSNIKTTYSSLSVLSSNSTLFFGSPQSTTLRNWAITAGSSVVWTELATSPLVVRDASFTNDYFNQGAYNPAAQYAILKPTNVVVNVNNITNAFSANHLYTP